MMNYRAIHRRIFDNIQAGRKLDQENKIKHVGKGLKTEG